MVSSTNGDGADESAGRQEAGHGGASPGPADAGQAGELGAAEGSAAGDSDAALSRACAAIEELAAGVTDDAAARVAAAWALVADADPGLAARLPGYLAAGSGTSGASREAG